MSTSTESPDRSRRRFLLGAAGAAVALSACGADAVGGAVTTSGPAGPTIAGPTTAENGAPASAVSGPTTARFVSHGSTDKASIALTFHTNGDLGVIQRLFDVITRRQAKATAFIVGNWLEQHPDWAKRLVDGGFELANHTQTHLGFEKLSPATMLDEVSKCRDVLVRLNGRPGAFFRPSGTTNGIDSPSPAAMAAAGSAGYATVLGFDLDPFDYQDPGSSAVVSRTVAALHPGAIVSLHFGHPGTITALPLILDAIEQRGLTTVTASELLA